MARWVSALVLLASAGCNQLFGLEAPTRATSGDGGVDDAMPDARDGSSVAGYVRRLDISATEVTGGPHSGFPVLVRLSEPWLRSKALGGDVANTDGADIFFTLDAGTDMHLDFEIEEYGVDGVLVAWVTLPTLTATSSFYLHYGDATVTTSVADPVNVWSNSYLVVMHLDTPSVDARGTVPAFTTQALSNGVGMVAGAQTFDGAGSSINAGSVNGIDGVFDAGGTVEAWIRPTSFGEANFGRIATKGEDSGWVFYVNDVDANDSLGFFHGSNSTTYGEWVAPAGSINLSAWQHVAVVFDRGNSGSAPIFYVNGVNAMTTKVTDPSGAFDTDAQHDLYIGNRGDGTRAFAGQLDELRLSSAVRSAGWLRTQYANQASPSTFYTVSSAL